MSCLLPDFKNKTEAEKMSGIRNCLKSVDLVRTVIFSQFINKWKSYLSISIVLNHQ